MTIRNNGRKVVLANRRIRVPEEIKEIHDNSRIHGDYKNIVNLINDPLASVTKVGRTIRSGIGEPDVVEAIIKYYMAVREQEDKKNAL